MNNPDLRRRIKVRMRPDLVIKPIKYGGQTFYVVKDPVCLRYFRFREEELFLLQQFDGNRTFDDVRHEFVEKFRPQRISVEELERFVGQLLQAGIATVDTPQAGKRLYERYKKRKYEKIKQTLLNVLYLKVPLFDPEHLLDRMLPYTRFMFTIPFFILMVLLWISAGLLVLVHWEDFVRKLPAYYDFFTWRNFLYFWLVLAVVKIMHEFGHGLSCKKFGGEVHEMGLLFLVLTPCLYCNVTDAWMLPNKWHRVVIGAAGIYVELILASLATWIWWYSDPGLLNTLCLSVMFVCSVSTVLFNGNPLLRFDGYYILADLMEIPNLRERSNKYLGNVASKFYFGAEAVQDPYLPKNNRWFFATYAVAAYMYRWLVVVGILWFFYTLLEPYKLLIISKLLAIGACFLLLVYPAYKTLNYLKTRWKTMKVNKTQMYFRFAATTAILLLLLFIPLPMRVDVPMILQLQNPSTVFVPMNQLVLKDLDVQDGEVVPANKILAVFDNPELRKKMEEQKLQKEMLEEKRRMRRPEALAQIDLINESIRKLQEEEAKMHLRSPVSGTVLLPPKEQDLGKTYQQGDMFCQMGDPTKLEAYLAVPFTELTLIQPEPPETSRRVWLKLEGHVGKILEGRTGQISPTELTELPAPMSNKNGGEVATQTDPESQREIPLTKTYAVLVLLDNNDGTLKPGVRGWARIDVGYRSIFWRVKRYFLQTFDLTI